MNTPIELRYSKEHEWARLDNDVIVVGITDFAQQQLTDIVFVELPDIGKTVSRRENLCVVESVKSVSDVQSPVSGTVIEVNMELSEKPELINEDPYGKGWIAKIRYDDKGELGNLMSSDEYTKYAGN